MRGISCGIHRVPNGYTSYYPIMDEYIIIYRAGAPLGKGWKSGIPTFCYLYFVYASHLPIPKNINTKKRTNKS